MERLYFKTNAIDHRYALPEIIFVLLYCPTKDQLILFRHNTVNGKNTNYIEANDGLLVLNNCLENLVLNRDSIIVELNEKGKKKMGSPRLMIDFNFGLEEFNNLKKTLNLVLKPNFFCSSD